MDQNHFHSNINSGHETGPYNKKSYSNPDPRHGLKQDAMKQKESFNLEQNAKAQIDLEQHKKIVNTEAQAKNVEHKEDKEEKQ